MSMASLTIELPLLGVLPKLPKVPPSHVGQGAEVSDGAVEARCFQAPLRRVLGLFGTPYLSLEEVDAALRVKDGMLQLAEALYFCQGLPVDPSLGVTYPPTPASSTRQ